MQKTNFQMVNEFHNVFGHKNSSVLLTNILENDYKTINFRISMIDEEFDEFIDAHSKKDFKECIDAICDMLYFIYGTFDVIGYNFDNILNNHTKEKYNFDNVNHDVFEKYEYDCLFHIHSIYHNIKMLRNCTVDKNLTYFINSLIRLENICQTLSTLFGVDSHKCFAEVHRSNMTKLCKTEQEAINTVNTYKQLLEEGKSSYNEPSFRYDEKNGYWIVYDNTTSKILKSINFELPKFYFE